jgi:hypothetical protein
MCKGVCMVSIINGEALERGTTQTGRCTYRWRAAAATRCPRGAAFAI